MTVRELLAAYLAHCTANGVHGEEARTQRECTFKRFAAAYGDVRLADVKTFMLADFIASHPTYRSMATKRGVANAIKAAWNWAVNEERIDRSPFHRVRYADADPRPAMPDDVYHEVCELANKRYERAVRFLRMTALRVSELSRLTWPDCDLERGIAIIHRHKSFRYTHRPKTVMLIPEAIELLRCLKAQQPAGYDGIIFLNTRDRPWNRRQLAQQLTRMKKRYGISTPAGLHGLRHAFAQTAANAGAPMKMISLQLGHASAAFTEKRYASVGYAAENIKAATALGQPAPDA